jgi:hypothetical protein
MFQKKEERFLNIKGALYNNIGGITKFVWKKPDGTPVEGYSANLYSYEFDGVNEYVTFGDVLSLERTDAFSFSFWIKPNSNNGMILGKKAYFNTSNKLRFQLIADNSTSNWILVDSTNTVSLNEWTHVTVTYSGNGAASGVSIYLNGSLETPIVTADNLTADISNNIDFNIGARNNGNLPFNGRIDEVVYLSSELSATDVTALYNDGFPSDPASLSPSNQIRLGDGDVLAKGLGFDGTNEYINFGNNLDQDGSNPFSISLWFNPSTVSLEALISKYVSNSWNGYTIYIQSSKIYFILGNNTSNAIQVNGSTTLLNNTLYHLVLTYDGSKNASGVNIYLNNSSETLTPLKDTLTLTTSNTDDLNIGRFTAGNLEYEGEILNVSFFNSELTAGSAETLYNKGIPKLATDLGLLPTNEWDLTKEFKKSLTFDGVNERIFFGDVLSLTGSEAFSFGFWIKPNTLPPSAVFFLGRYEIADNQGYGIYQNSNKLRVVLTSAAGNRINIETGAILTTGVLQNIFVTYDGSKDESGIRLYLDGVLQSHTALENSLTGDITTTKNFTIGSANASFYYNGQMMNVSYFNSELTSGNASTFYNNGVPRPATELGLSPSNQWNMFDETTDYWDGSEIIINDSVGSISGFSVNMEEADITDYAWTVYDEVGSVDGFSVNMEETDEVVVGWIADDITGSAEGISVNMEETDRKLGVAYSADFNGTDEYITHGDVLDFEKTDEFTLSAWVKFDGGTENAIISKIDGTNTGYGLLEDGTGKVAMYLWSNSSFIRNYIFTPTDNVWYHVLATYDGSNTAGGIKGYVDSVLRPDSLTGSPLAGSTLNTANLEVGTNSNFSFIHDGNIMMYSIFNKKLNQLEINELYNSGVPIKASSTTITNNVLDCVLFGSEDTATTIKDYSGNKYDGALVNMDLTNKSSDTP